jgi:hypothetical protein
MQHAWSVRLKHDCSDYIATQMKTTVKAEIRGGTSAKAVLYTRKPLEWRIWAKRL